MKKLASGFPGITGGLGVLFLLVAAVYSNHFTNSFHFDDAHTILENPWIASLKNIPRFFADGNTFSTLPPNRSYRPMVSTSLAIDYRLSGGLKPLWFHISTFFWYLTQLAVMFFLFLRTLDRTRPAAVNSWVAVFATAIYGLHPVMAETVNYIIQRGDLYAALGVAGGMSAWIGLPRYRRFGLYLVPVLAGVLSKPSAVVFPALLFLWVRFFEEKNFFRASKAVVPALAVTGAAAIFVTLMNPPSFVSGAASATAYRLSQPAVLFSYFRRFFAPYDLSADTDRVPYSNLFDGAAFPGVLFLIGLGFAIWFTARRPILRPISFGLCWFLVSSLPTSLIALAEVENDHRMYLPFIGLALAVSWAAALLFERFRIPAKAAAAIAALALIPYALMAHERNRVWHEDESLWYDVTVKSPKNGRGLMNYGLTQMARGDYTRALEYFRKALPLTPNYYLLAINTGVASSALGRTEEAEREFRRAISLQPLEAAPHFYYGRWLYSVHRDPEAISQLQTAARQNPDFVAASHLLMRIYTAEGDAAAAENVSRRTLARFPADSQALATLELAQSGQIRSPESYLDMSLALYRAGKYNECIAAARQALAARPGYAEAWNNIAAAYNSLSQWDKGIDAARKAVLLKPDFQLAKNNLAWALDQKRRAGQK